MNTESLSILLVDDDTDTRNVLAMYLRASGHTVDDVDCGKAAIQNLHAHTFDLVITDMLMPDVDGLEVISAARRAQPGVAIISMTGGGEYLDCAQLLKMSRLMGADAQLMKPFAPAQLTEAIRRVSLADHVVAA